MSLSPAPQGSDAPDERDLLAAEYVIGLLDPAARALAERRNASDPNFAALVEDWRERLLALDDAVRIRAPAVDLWDRIAAQTQRAPAAPARVVRQGSTKPQLLASLRFWQGLGFAGAATALLLAVVAGLVLMRAVPKPVLVAVLVTEANRPAAIVTAFEGGDTELVPLEEIEVPAGKTLEVWTLWDRSVGPRSIARLDRAKGVRLALGSLPLGPGQLFEITLEPAGGSPIGRPTGPILMKGTTSPAL